MCSNGTAMHTARGLDIPPVTANHAPALHPIITALPRNNEALPFSVQEHQHKAAVPLSAQAAPTVAMPPIAGPAAPIVAAPPIAGPAAPAGAAPPTVARAVQAAVPWDQSAGVREAAEARQVL